jgi:beta-galactosidase
VPRKSTVVNLDLAQAGIGSNSCGPRLQEKYLLNDEKYHFSVRLLLGNGEDVCPFEQTGY